jgi:hypothetical protein
MTAVQAQGLEWHASEQDALGCVARVTFEFCHRPEWLQEGARLIVHDRTDNCMSGAGIVERILQKEASPDANI